MTDSAFPSDPDDAPELTGDGGTAPKTDEERRIVALIQAGLDSGPSIPLDEAFFQRVKSNGEKKD